MTRSEPDTDAIGKLIKRHTASAIDDKPAAHRRGVGDGMDAAADLIDKACADPEMLKQLRRDPALGLRLIEAAIRKAAPR